jgi:hypothetical protein
VPVQVHVPIRLRVDAEALALHPDTVDGALARALDRALARSRAEVPALGGYLGVRVEAPSIRWSGDALDEVADATRVATEALVKARIAAAVEAAGLARRGRAVDALAGRPAERADPRRRRLFGRYVVDSYDGGTTTLPADSSEAYDGPVSTVWRMGEIGEILSMRWLRIRLTDERGVREIAASAGPTGLVLRYPTFWDVYVTTDGFATEAKSRVFNFPPQMRRNPVRHGDKIVFEEVLSVPPTRPCMLTEISLPEGEGERRELLRTLMAANMRSDIRDMFDPGEAADELLLSEADFNALVEATIDSELDTQVKRIPAGAKVMVRLDWGDVRWDITLPSALLSEIGWSGAGQLMPVSEEIEGRVAMFGTDGAAGAGARKQDSGGGTRTGKDRGDPGAGEGGSRYGIGGAGEGGGDRLFPSYGEGIELVCEKFEDAEPEPEALGTAGKAMAALVAEIAERLQIPVCKYAATFCVNAARSLAPRASAVGLLADSDTKGRFTQSAGAGKAKPGQVSFAPVASPSIQLLRRLAQAAVRIADLRRMVRDCYMHGAGSRLLSGRYAEGNGNVSWTLRFDEAVSPAMKEGVGEIFTQTCQVLMLQLLVTSAEQIVARQRNLSAYAGIFQEILVRRLSDVGTLTHLRDRLKAVETAHAVQGYVPAVGGVPGLEWAGAARALADACVATEGFEHLPGGATQDIVWRDGVARIRDQHGFLWTRQALEEEIVRERGEAESIDPLIQQLTDLPETVERFRRDPGSAYSLLSDLLYDMAFKNREKQEEARADRLFGLQAGRISESFAADEDNIPGYTLGGIHKLAHEQIGQFFRGDDSYAEGIDHAFSVELGKQGLTHFFEFTGIILLSVLCPPAAFVAGVAIAAHEVEKAESRADLYKALINPELVLNRAEIELERYIAYAGLVLSLVPEATTAIKAASLGVRGAARVGVVGGLRIAGRSIVRTASRQVTEALSRELLPTLVREVATQVVMDQVLQAVLGPVIEHIEKELQLRTAVGGRQGALALIEAIERSAQRRADAPLPPGFDDGAP